MKIEISKEVKEELNGIIENAKKHGLKINHSDLLDYLIASFYDDDHFEDLMNYYGYEAYVNMETKETTYEKEE